MKTCPTANTVQASDSTTQAKDATLRDWMYWWTGYLAYTLYHVIGLPIVLIRFAGRLRSGRYRGVIGTRFWGGTPPPKSFQGIWIVASALGETRTAIQAAEEIQRVHQEDVMVMTQLAKLPAAVRVEGSPFPVGFAPFNSPISALFAILRRRPKQILFVEFSGNYHLAFVAKLLGIPTALINVNLPEARKRRLLKKPLGKWQFSFVSAFCVQAETHHRRLLQLGVEPERIRITGISLSLLQVLNSSFETTRKRWRELLQVSPETPIILAGSTYHDEEVILLEAVARLRQTHPEAVLVLAPRHLNRRAGGDSALRETGTDFERRSLLDRHERVAKTILLDSLGELREAYSCADVAFIGGTLIENVGGHTPLEPLSWGIPMTLGPYYGQHEAAVQIITERQFAEICPNAESLAAAWKRALSKPGLRDQILRQASELADASSNAHARAYAILKRCNANGSD